MEFRINPVGIGVAFEGEEDGEPTGRKTLMVFDQSRTQVSVGPLEDQQWESLRDAINDPEGFVKRTMAQADARAKLVLPGDVPVVRRPAVPPDR